jgi:DNA-directed RNA polymerase subunit F
MDHLSYSDLEALCWRQIQQMDSLIDRIMEVLVKYNKADNDRGQFNPELDQCLEKLAKCIKTSEDNNRSRNQEKSHTTVSEHKDYLSYSDLEAVVRRQSQQLDSLMDRAMEFLVKFDKADKGLDHCLETLAKASRDIDRSRNQEKGYTTVSEQRAEEQQLEFDARNIKSGNESNDSAEITTRVSTDNGRHSRARVEPPSYDTGKCEAEIDLHVQAETPEEANVLPHHESIEPLDYAKGRCEAEIDEHPEALEETDELPNHGGVEPPA